MGKSRTAARIYADNGANAPKLAANRGQNILVARKLNTVLIFKIWAERQRLMHQLLLAFFIFKKFFLIVQAQLP